MHEAALRLITMSEEEKRVVICLPTYNERENLAPLTREIHRLLPEALLLIIDDASPDGTGQVANTLAGEDARIKVLHRQAKDGLGRAYAAGFAYALAELRPTIIVQMDADFSHPAEVLPLLLDTTRDHDLVIASRYVPGGGTENWNVFRRLISRFGSYYARWWLGLPIRDLTSGFKVWQSGMLAKVIREPVAGGGYVFQVETTWTAARLGARIAEVPFIFTDRQLGRSKMSAAIALEAFWRLPCLAFRGWRQGQAKKRG